MTDAACLADALIAFLSGEASEKILNEYAETRRQVFDKVTNPTSQKMKQMVQSDATQTEELVSGYFKRLNEDEAFQREGLMGGYALLTRLEGIAPAGKIKKQVASLGP